MLWIGAAKSHIRTVFVGSRCSCSSFHLINKTMLLYTLKAHLF